MDIWSHIANLRNHRDLLKIDAEIDGRLELAALTDLVVKHAGPGLLFTQVKGARLYLATNLFGSERRMAAALGQESLVSFGRLLTAALVGTEGNSSSQCLQRLLRTVETEHQPTSRRSQPLNLDLLPELRFWPAEERSFLTLAVVITREAASRQQNYGLYRVGRVGERSLSLNLLPGSGASQHLKQWRALGKSMPVAILLGADPALIFAAAAPLPRNCAEESFCAYLMQTKFESCRCQTLPLDCPSSGQMVIEGWITSDASVNEGPFGCFTGDYGGSNACPLVEVSALSSVAEPLIPLTLAGPLPMEDCWIAKANLEVIRARLAIDLPQISSLEMPLETAFHRVYFVRSKIATATVDELAEKMRRLDYLAGLKMLVLLRDADKTVGEDNWRKILTQISSEQIWQDPAADLAALFIKRTPSLQHDARMLENLLQRLQIDVREFTAGKEK